MTAADPNTSGINLSRPSDSGINLQRASGFGLGQADSIELAPLSDEELETRPAKASKPAKPAAAQEVAVLDASARGEEGREGHLRRHRFRG